MSHNPQFAMVFGKYLKKNPQFTLLFDLNSMNCLNKNIPEVFCTGTLNGMTDVTKNNADRGVKSIDDKGPLS